MTLLSVTSLCKHYVRTGKPLTAVDRVTFAMAPGDSVSIIGRSGSGKTTLIGMIAGLISPTDGEVILEDQNIHALDDAASSLMRNTVIGYVPQGTSLLPALTALDNVRLPRYLVGAHSGDCTAKAISLMEEMGVAHLHGAYPSDLSGGEMRRIAIARALVNSPRLLIADEPTSDLDEESANNVMRLLARVNSQGTALLVVTHDMALAGIAARTMTMASGRLTHGGRADEAGAARKEMVAGGGVEALAS